MAVADIEDLDDPVRLQRRVDGLEARAERLRCERAELLQEAARLRGRLGAIQLRRRDYTGIAIPADELDRVECVVRELGAAKTVPIAERLNLSQQQARDRLKILEVQGRVKREGLRQDTLWMLGDGEPSRPPERKEGASTRVLAAAQDLGTFTTADITDALGLAYITVSKWCKHYVDQGVFARRRDGKRHVYEFLLPERRVVNREKRTPPEVELIERRERTREVRQGRRYRVRPEVRDLIHDIRAAGGTLVPGGSHPKVVFQGRVLDTVPLTPSDHRSVPNTRAKLRREGLPV